MLQIKNIKPNFLTNTPLVLDENNIGTFSFEIEGNEDANSYDLIFTDLNFDISQDFSATISSSNYSNNLKEDYPEVDYITPINSDNRPRPDLPDFPENLKLFLTFNYSFTLKNINTDFNVLLGSHKISYSFSIPYKIYCTHNGTKNSSGEGYQARRILSSQNIEESNNVIEFSDSYYIYNNQNEEFINITGSQTVDLSEVFNLYLKNIKDDSKSLAVYSDYISIKEPIDSFLKEYEYFPKFSFSFNNDSFLPLYDDKSTPSLDKGAAEGVLIYLLSPTLTIDNIVSEKKYVKEIDKPYKTPFGKNNVFSFDVEVNDYLKKAEKFYINLNANKEIILNNGQKGLYAGKDVDNLKAGDFNAGIPSTRGYSLQVYPKEKYSITTILKSFYYSYPAINFYNSLIANNESYINSIFLSSTEQETIEIEIPENVVLMTINCNTKEDSFTITKLEQQSFPLVSYNILSLPTVSNILLSKYFNIKNNYDYGLSFQYSEENQYSMLWYQVKIFNIYKEKESLILNTGQVFTSQNKIIIEPIHLLPDEKYYYEIQVGDIQNMISQVYTNKENPIETLGQEKQINFADKSINKYLSESFVVLDLNKFGIGSGSYPSQALYPLSTVYPEIEFASMGYNNIKILREDISSKQSIWIGEYSYKENLKIIDYGVKANIPYNYWGYVKIFDEEINDNLIYGIKLNDEPIIAEWDRWTLVTADKDPEDEKVYHVDKVFTFEMNLSSGSMTNGTNITISKNFTEFPVIQKDKSNFYSGSLTALIGVRKWGSTAEDFEQTPQMLEDLRQLSTNYQSKFLKDRSGHLWQVEINGAIQVANTDNLATIDLKTMTVPWVQIGEADNISLIYTGTEKKEDLYC